MSREIRNGKKETREKGEDGDVNCEAEELQDVGKQGKLDYEAEKD